MKSNIKMGIYLVQPKGRSLKPIDTNPKFFNRYIKVNNQFIKFGKFERPADIRWLEYKKIFGNDVKFKTIVNFSNREQLIDFRNHISQIFEIYKISNPGSKRKLEWMHGITFSKAEKIILKEYERSFYQSSGLNYLISNMTIMQFTRLYDLSFDSLLDWANQKSKPIGRPLGSKGLLGKEVKTFLKGMIDHFKSQKEDISNREIANKIHSILNAVSEEKIGNAILIKIRRLSAERLRKLLD